MQITKLRSLNSVEYGGKKLNFFSRFPHQSKTPEMTGKVRTR